jgi:phosphoglycolate phosphatase
MREHVTYDYLVFDLDGTLSDPKAGIVRSINHALASNGYRQLPEAELVRYIGPPLDQTFSRIIGVSDVIEIFSLVESYRERYAAVGYAENTIYDGIPHVLAKLVEEGAILGVCTSKRRDFAEMILDMFGIRALFRFVDGGDIGVHKWQQLEGLVQRGVVTRDSVMIGDRDVDLIAAHRNGLQSAGVLWGYGSPEELQNESPRHLLESPAGLYSLIA